LRAEAEDDPRDGTPDQREHEDRPPAAFVREPAEVGGEDELHERVGGGEQADIHVGDAERADVEGEDRDDDPEADEVDEDDDDDGGERPATAGLGGTGRRPAREHD